MPFEPIAADSVAKAVRRQIELLILRGVLRPGERLPGERDLAERLNVSRPSLREALAELEAAGLIEIRPNAGARVAQLFGSVFTSPLQVLFGSHEEAVFDFIVFRREIEAMAAARAATEGGDADLALIDAAFTRMEAAHGGKSPAQDSALDVEFHMSVVEAANNIVMLHVMRSMHEVLQAGVLYNRRSLFIQHTTRDAVLDQHRAINDAIQARNGPAAHAAMSVHLDAVEKALRAQLRQQKHDRIARQRLENTQSRT